MKWVELSVATGSWALVADDGEIVDKLYGGTYGIYLVESTNKRYISLEDAKNAVIRARGAGMNVKQKAMLDALEDMRKALQQFEMALDRTEKWVESTVDTLEKLNKAAEDMKGQK